MFLSKQYKKKYRKELTVDENLTFFAFKVVGVVTLYFVMAAAIDTYRVIHKMLS